MNQQSFTIQEAARFLGVSPTTLRRWEEKKMLMPYRTVGNQRRYTREQLQDFKNNALSSPLIASEVTPSTIPALQESSAALETPAQAIAKPTPELVAPAFIPTALSAEPYAPQVQNEENVQVSNPQPRQSFNASAGFQMPQGGDNRKPNFIPLAAVIFAALVLFSGVTLVAGIVPAWSEKLDTVAGRISAQDSSASGVLAANDATAVFRFQLNVPSVFGKQASFLDSVSIKKGLTVEGLSLLTGGVRTNNADIDAGTGELTASNVVYSIVSGSNITVSGDPQNPVISADFGNGLVSSFQGQTGAVALAQGSGIGLDGLTITNTGVLSLQGQSGALSFSPGAGITLNGLTITNSDPGSSQKIFSNFTIGGTTIAAGSNTDTFTFAAGSGVTLTPNTTDKTLTISATGTAPQWTTTGSDIYYNLGNVGIGNTAPGRTLDVTGTGRFSGAFTLSSFGTGIVKSDATGLLSSSALNLGSSEVTGALAVGNGGTGLSSIPTNGQLLIGNGTNYTLGNLTGTTNQISISNGAGSITFSTPQDIHTSASPTFATLNLSNLTNQITFGSGNTGTISMDVLTTNRTYTLPDASGTFCLTSGNCSGGGGGGIAGSGTTNYIAKFTSSSGISDSSIYDNGRIGIGTTSPEGLLTVSGGPAGKALAVFNYTGSGQDILTASASGTTRLVLSNSGNLNIIGGGYQINGVNVLSDATLGSGVTNSSLTSVGTLNAGSISSGFGNIDVGTDSILGGDITSSGTTGLISTGNGAGLSFSGTGNHDITASSGVLRFGSATLTGAITGSGQDITGLGALSANGAVTFGGLGTGVVQSDGTGLLSSAALNLAGGASYVSGVLPTANGGTGLNSYNTGDMLYASAGNTLSALPIGSEGQVLAVSGSGVPTWISAGSLNYWQRANGAIAPINISDDLLIGGVATSSAKFQVFGISGDVRTAGTFTFTNAGVIQSTSNQSITIGGSTTGDITLAPQNGAGTVFSTGDLSLATGKAYQINGANVLTASTLGSSVTTSSLTTVGALSSGTIVNGFGTINSNNTITGTTLNATTGLNTGGGGGTQRITNTGDLVNIGSTQLNGVTYTWPGADGSGNTVLTTNGSGGLSWADVSTLPGVGDITSIGDVTSGAAFTATGTQGTSLYFYDAQGRGQLTIANLTGPQTYTLPNDSGEICLNTGNCAGSGGGLTGAGTAGQIAFFDGAGTLASESTGFMWDAVNNKFGLGTDTPEGRLSVSGAGAGKALVVFNETGDQDIFTASASGTTMLTLGRNGNLAIEGELSDLTQNAITINDSVNLLSGNMYEINGTSVLSGSTLGSGVINSSLTSVGALASGSIANGFGSIFTTNTIQGSDITASGTTGFTATGNGAGLTFSGTGNHIISASSGTLQIGAATLTGGITGNSQNIVGVNNFSASGTITFGGLSTGIVKSDGSGNLSASAVALGSADVTGTLAVGNGGTGVTSVGSAGSVAYSNGATYAFSAVGSGGQVLVSGGTGSPTWVDAATIGTNYWQRNGGLLSPASITDDLAVGGNSTGSAKFQIFGDTGNASTSGSLTFNGAGNVQTTNNQTLTFGGSSTGNIVFSPLNGAGTVSVNGNINLASSNTFRINSTDVLTATTLGSGVTASSLTSVGALSSGSIANGFGSIATSDTITGTTLNATTGINTGGGAGTTRITDTGNLVNIGSTELNGVTYTWPGADGSSDYVLTTDSSGGLTWKNVTSVGAAGDITAIGDVTSGAAFTAAGTQGTSLYFYDADGRGQLTTANLTQARTYTLPNASGEICLVEAGNCAGAGGGITGSGTAGQISYFDGANTVTSEDSGFAWDATNNRLGIGNDTPNGMLDVTGANTGKSLVVFNETGDQDIITASASGTTMLVLNRNGNLGIEGQLSDLSQNALTVNDSLNLTTGNEFQINGTSVLTGSTLGSGVINSSLTSVGALATGSIVNGFGSIFTGSTIQGSDITASGTTGFTSSGNGAGLTFSGTGNHSISASGGVLQIGAATLTGAITGNSQNITGVNNFSAGGTITLGGLSTGIVKSNGSGVLSSSAVGLNTADVTGTLPVGNGGTGVASFTSNGVVYGNGSSALSVTSAPTGGQVLLGNASGVPTFMTLTGGVTVSNTGVTSIALSSSSDTATTSSNSGLEFSTANGLSLLRGCANDEILKWDETAKVWQCGIDSGGAGSAGTINIQNNEGAIGTNVDTVDFSTDFTVAASPSNEANVSIADDILDFTEIADNLTLDASTTVALSNFNLTLGTNAGNGGVIVSPNAGGNAALIVNKQGTGDVFTASASGTTVFTINNNGYIGLGGSAPTTDQYITTPNFTVENDGDIYAPSINNPLTATNAYIDLNATGIELGRNIADSNVALTVVQGNAASTGDILRLNNNAGTMLSLSQAGVLNLGASGYANCSALETVGGVVTCGSDDMGSAGVNYWQLNNGTVSPFSNTLDLLVGGTSTASAKFAVLNVNNGTPTASVSAGANGAAYITASGSIGTTNRQSLTIGSGTTGNIVLDGFGAGIIRTNASGVLSSSAINLASADVTGTLPVGNGGTGVTSFTSNGVVYGNAGGALSVTSAPTGGQVLLGNGSGVPTFTSISGGVTLSDAGVASIILSTSGETATTGSNSGLEFSTANGLSLLRGCSDGQILKWDDSNDVWECGSDAGGTGGPAGVVNIENNDSGVGTDVDTIDFSTDFAVSASPSDEANVSIADDVLDFSEFADGLNLDAATQLALNNFDFTLGTNAGNGGVVIAPNAGGNAALIVNKQGTGDILTASASGTTRLTLNSAGDLNIIGGSYQIGGNTVLTGTALGTNVVGSSLTSVGALNSGSISSGFGSIDVGADAISGGNITASGVTGFTASGNGAGLTFSGTGDHDITASGGTLRLGAATLLGTITGNGQDITGLDALSASGAITFGSFTTNGGLLYTNGSGQVAQLGNGVDGECLQSNGAAAPVWGNCADGSINHWDLANGALSAKNTTVDLLIGGTSTASAKFAVLNVNSGTPTASVSGSTGATSLTANGVLGTTNMQSLTFGNSTTGNIVLNGFTTGVVKTNASGVLSSSAISLANGSADITGTLSVANGGTGAISLTQGGVLYGNGTSPVAASAQGTGGQALLSGGTGAPTWTTGALALAGNFTTSGANALTLTTTGATNVTLPTTGILATLAGTETLSGKTLTAPRFANGGFIADANGNEQIIFNTTASAINELSITNAAASGVVALAATGGDTNIPLSLDSKGTGELRLNGTATGNILLGGGSSSTGCTVTNANGNFACAGTIAATGAISGSNFSGTSSGTNTGDQTITLTGDISGTGTGSFGTTIQDNAVDGSDISLTSEAQGNLMYFNGTDWVRLANGTENQVLHSGTTPSWSAIDLSADITGILGSTNGGTGANLSASTQGSVPYFSATGVMSALAPGAAGYVLTTNGAGQNPTWTNAAGLGTNYWQVNNGTVSPFSNTLDLLVGGTSSSSAKFAVLNVNNGTPTASVSAGTSGAAYITAAGTLQTTANQTLTLGGNTTGNIVLDSGNGLISLIDNVDATNGLDVTGASLTVGGANASITTAGAITGTQLDIENLRLDGNTLSATSGDITLDATGGNILLANGDTLNAGGGAAAAYNFFADALTNVDIADGDSDLFIGDELEVNGDVRFDSANITLANAAFTSCSALETVGGVLTCGSDDSGGVANYWRLNQGTVSPYNDTLDLLVGGSSSSSAKFAVLNVNSGTPTASVSAGTAGGASLTATGVLGTTNQQSLTLGNATTGNIVLNGFTTGVVKTNASGVLSSSAISLANGSADISGTLSVANGGTGAVSLTQGGVLYGNGTSPVAASAQGTSGQALLSGGTGAPTWTTGALALAGNFTTSGANALTLTTTGATNVTLPTTGILATLAGTETLSGKTLTAPRFANGGFIADANGNEQIIFNTTASAVNELSITNAATAGVVALAATGGDTNIPLSLDGKGTGELRLNGTGTGNILLGGGFGATGCTVTNSSGAFACNGAVTGSNISGSTSGTNTGDQTITLTGDVSGTGTGSFSTTIQDNSVDGTDIALGSDTQGDIMYYDGTNWVRLAMGGANTFLHSGTNPSWSSIDLTTDVTGTLPINRGGTNATATPTNGGIAYGTGTAYAFTSAGVSNECLKSNGAAAPTWGACGGANLWQEVLGAISPYSSTLDFMLGGSATNSAKFAVTNMTGSGTPTASVSATTTGNGLTLAGDGRIQSLRNNTLNIGGNTTGNITMSPRNGAGAVTVDGELNLTTGNTFQINSTDILSSTTLGSSVTISSLDAVDALNAGSITSGFGAIDTGTDAISGGTLTGTSTTGLVLTGNGSGINFQTGTGTHTIQASAGTLQINAFAMGGTITGGGNAITGLGQLTVDNLSLDGNTFSATSGDINISATGGNVLFASGTTLNVGGGAEAAYNFFADSISSVNGTNINSDNDLYVEGNLEVDGTIFANVTGNVSGGTVTPTGFTQGSVVFAGSGGTLAQDNANYFFDDTTNRLGLGTTTPTATLDVNGAASVSASLNFRTGAGAIQTTANNTLTLGGSTTGDIVIDENVFLGSGTTGLNVTTAGVLSDVNGTAVEINDDLQVTGNDILSSGGTTAITLSGANVTVAGDLTVSGGDIVGIATASIFDSVSTTINMGSAATLVNLMDSATTKVIDIGGVTNGGADTINIATNATGTDTIAIGNANAATTLALTGGDDWSITGAGVITGTQVNVDNLRLDANTFSAVSGDITLDAAGGDIIIANGDTLNVGGYTGGVAYNVIGSAAPGANNNTADGDTDLYIEDELEVDGIVTIGSTTNGIQFDPAAGPTYYGTARITRKLTLSPEYAGAVLTASGSANTNGFMTSDASSSATFNFRQYYEWTSTQTSLQDYTIAVRVTLPPDFSAWATSNAIDIAYNTELTSNTRNKFDLLLFQESSATPVAYRQANVSGTEKTWTTLTIDDSDLTDGTGWDAAGETAVFYLKVYSRDNNHVQIGDIVLNYLTNK